MSREEKLNKILEMYKEIINILGNKISNNKIDKIYIQTNFMLEAYKELKEEENK